MKEKAGAILISNTDAELHMFNVKDKLYRKYGLTRMSEGKSEEIAIRGVLIEIPPYVEVEESFYKVLEAQNNMNDFLAAHDFTIDLQGQITLTKEERYEHTFEKLYGHERSDNHVRPDVKGKRCIASLLSPQNRTPFEYIMSPVNRANLFNAIMSNQNSEWTRNKMYFFETKNKYFELLSELAYGDEAQGFSEIASAISADGPESNAERINMPDGGFMLGKLDFTNKTVHINFAKDGDCNEIPLKKADVKVTSSEFDFNSLSGHNNFKKHLVKLGFTVAHELLDNERMCVKTRIVCYVHRTYEPTCDSICLRHK